MDLYQLWATYNKPWFKNEICFFGMILVFTIAITIFYVHRKKITVIQAIAVCMLTVFLGIVFGSTIFTRTSTIRQYELLSFWSWLAVIRYRDWGLLKENFLNCILLMPAGALLPLIVAQALGSGPVKRCRKKEIYKIRVNWCLRMPVKNMQTF